jgi:hypothetical protein
MLKQHQNIFRVKHLEESLIIDFGVDEIKGQVEFIAVVSSNLLPKDLEELTEKELTGHHDREFAKFRFLGVAHFQRKNGANDYIGRTGYAAKEEKSTTIYGIHFSKWKGRNKFEACFASFGEIEFTFSEIEFATRLSRVIRKKDEMQDYDIVTKTFFDFNKPFHNVED